MESRAPRVFVCILAIGLSCVALGGCSGEVSPDGTPPASSASDPGDGHRRMVELLAEVAGSVSDAPYIGDGLVEQLRSRIAALDEDAEPELRFQLHVQAGEAELRLGYEQEAIEHLLEAQALLSPGDNRAAAQLAFELGTAYMRLGETENCCRRNAPESCILPIRGRGVHTRPEGSRRAMEQFERVLAATPETSGVHLAARWLLNIACMTLGEYPAGVPERYRIPPERFESTVDFPRFVNIASSLGLDTFDLSGGAIVDDFDNDGYLDIVTSTWDPSGPMRYFANDGDGGFTERSDEAGLTGLTGGLNMVQADFDNDGHLDILVLRGAWLANFGRHPNSLLKNLGDGRFLDVTFAAGLGQVHLPTQTAGWADYDNDGDLDLFIGNESSDGLEAPCQLFRNDGDASFTDVAAEAGVDYRGYPKGVAWGDYDHDRFPDLYVSEYDGPNLLYHNNGDGSFSNVALQAGVARPHESFPVWFWDYDNDGSLDLFVASYSGRVQNVGAHFAGLESDFELPGLYRGDGRGSFRNVARQAGLDVPLLPMGSNFGDLDLDGYPDFYLGTGDPSYQSLMPNLMFLNVGGESFVDVTMAGGFGHLQKGHAVAFADLDNDGDLDVFEQMGGAFPGDEFHDALYENPGFGQHWIGVELVGRTSNRSAIGARIEARIEEQGRPRSIFRHVNSGGSFGGNPLRQTLGLGAATSVRELVIEWPTSGEVQRFREVEADRVIRVIEGETDYQPRIFEPLTFRRPRE